MVTAAPFLSDVFRGRGLGTDPIVAVSAPILNASGTPSGIVEGSLDLKRFARFTQGTSARVMARLIIVDRGGRIVYSFGASDLKLLQDVTGTPFGRALAQTTGDEPIAYDDGGSGGVMLAAIARSNTTGWRIVVEQPRSVARGAGRTYLFTILVGIALAALIAIALALRLASRVTRPIDLLSAALRKFDAQAPLSIAEPLSAETPAEIASLVSEFAGMSSRVHEYFNAKQASESRFRAIFDHAAIGIAVHDADGRISDANAAFQNIVGYSLHELQQMRASELSPPEDAEVTRGPVRALQAGQVDVVRLEKRFVHKKGHLITCELTVSRMNTTAEAANAGGIVGMLQDVTAKRRMERDVAWRADHDVLTGLANRARLHERLTGALERMEVPQSVAVLVLDLDEFKRVNDSLGHAAGDRLLCEVARRLLSATRGCDVVARLGGDEFAMVLDGAGSAVYAEVAARRILAALTRPIKLEGAEIVLSTSIGIAYASEDEVADELVRNADTAMYRAKHGGKGRFEVFTRAMHDDVINLLSMESDLRRAEESGELHATYQLIVDLRTGAPVGAECLMRWTRPGHGNVTPQNFIPVAEQTGLIIPLGRWILREACKQGAAWLKAMPPMVGDKPPFTITVNVSGRQLQHPQMVQSVRDALADSGFDARCLVLEITESVVMNNAESAINRLDELKALGVRLAIDDFGTGYSSLSYLQRLPIDILKIDKSFVDGLTDTSRDAALVRTILGLAETLSLRCVAEGIERPEQYEMLRKLGCQFGQGYLLARPLRAAEAGALLCPVARSDAA